MPNASFQYGKESRSLKVRHHFCGHFSLVLRLQRLAKFAQLVVPLSATFSKLDVLGEGRLSIILQAQQLDEICMRIPCRLPTKLWCHRTLQMFCILVVECTVSSAPCSAVLHTMSCSEC